VSAKHVRESSHVIARVIGSALFLGAIGAASLYGATREQTANVVATEPAPPTTTVTATYTRTVVSTRIQLHTVTRTIRPSRSLTRKSLPSGTNQSIAKELLEARGWSDEWSCLNNLINRESGWNVYATNAKSGAYGIPQSLPASKMASAGADWRTNPRTQLVWMMGYIKSTYSTPCGAWAHSQRTGWY
jgi:hypothetical protein